MVYRTESLNKESCEDFAAAFTQGVGITFSDAYYYDDMTYFANHSSGDTLSVDYRDSSYTYRLGTPLAVSEGSEAELRGLDGLLGRVENHLLALTPQREESLLPKAEAYDRMTSGAFEGASAFASLQPLEATVTACAITYQSDTKGYYQPVYRFTVMQDEAPFAEVLIPALQ